MEHNTNFQLTWLKAFLAVIGYSGMQLNNLEGTMPSKDRVVKKAVFRPPMKKGGVFVPRNLPRNHL